MQRLIVCLLCMMLGCSSGKTLLATSGIMRESAARSRAIFNAMRDDLEAQLAIKQATLVFQFERDPQAMGVTRFVEALMEIQRQRDALDEMRIIAETSLVALEQSASEIEGFALDSLDVDAAMRQTIEEAIAAYASRKGEPQQPKEPKRWEVLMKSINGISRN